MTRLLLASTVNPEISAWDTSNLGEAGGAYSGVLNRARGTYSI